MFKLSLNCNYFLTPYMPSVTTAVKHLSKISNMQGRRKGKFSATQLSNQH